MPFSKVVHKWTRKDREYLVLLKLRYRRKVIAPIFNQLLVRTLRREGFRQGLSAPALDAQYHEIKSGGNGYQIFAEMSTLSESRMKNKYKDHLRDIELVARTLGLRLEPGRTTSLVAKRNPSNTARKSRKTKLTRMQRSTSAGALYNMNVTDSITTTRRQTFADTVSPFFAESADNEKIGRTPDDGSLRVAAERVPPARKVKYNINGQRALTRPLLLFRATENPNAFRARRFADPVTSVPKPEMFGSTQYFEWAIHHLERCQKYLSPFMSFAQNPRNAIRRVEIARSEDVDNKRFLAIFSFNEMEANAANNFGPGAGPHPASMLFKGRVSDLPDGYTGNGEWLAHGFVDCEPLAVLDAAEVVTVAKAVRRFKAGDFTALADVGMCLQSVAPEWREAVAFAILRNYCGKKIPPTNAPAYPEMMNMVINATNESSRVLQSLTRLSVAEDGDWEESEKEEESEDEEYIEDDEGHTAEEDTRTVLQDAEEIEDEEVVDVDFEEIIPSIETNTSDGEDGDDDDDFVHFTRDDFLRGISAYVGSESPAAKTPSKPPRTTAASSLLNSFKHQQDVKYRTQATSANVMAKLLIEGSQQTTQVQPTTSERTKVPVIVRKRIVDDWS